MMRFRLHVAAIVLSLLVVRTGAEDDQYCNEIGDDGFVCDTYNPTTCYHGKCIPEFQTQVESFEPCKTSVCFLLKQEAPIIHIPEERKKRKEISTPFKCSLSRDKGVNGSLVDIFENTAAKDHYCVWVGDDPGCTWNEIQHLVASDGDYEHYHFAAAGPMLETAQRKCHHVPSSSWLDDRMVVIGNSTSTPDEDPFVVVTNPLSRNAWIFFATILFLHLAVFFVIGRRIRWSQEFPDKVAASFFLTTGDAGNILESGMFFENNDESESNETEPRKVVSNKPQYDYKERTSMLSATFVSAIFRFSLKASFLIFLIFYEAGLVNLLFFQNSSTLSRRTVGSLSKGKLPMYCVMKDSALANVWRNRVDPNNEIDENIWQEEDDLVSCLYRIMDRNDPVRFAVSYEREALHQIKEQNKADGVLTRLEIFELEDDIYRFNSGWLFKRNDSVANEVLRDKKKEMDIDIVQSRVNGDLKKWLDGDSKPEEANTITIGMLAICFIPFVYLPLLVAFCMLLLWGRLQVGWAAELWCLVIARDKRSKSRKESDEGSGV